MNTDPVIAVEASNNGKIGLVSATYQSQATCPSGCPFRGSGCYAESGVTAFHTRRLNDSPDTDVRVIAQKHADKIDGLSGRLDLRLDVVGDCPSNESARIVSDAGARFTAKHGRSVWTYTHAWAEVDRANWGDVSVLASTESADGIRAARARGYATAVVYGGTLQTKAFDLNGEQVIPCPNQRVNGPTCVDCRLCFDAPRLLAAKKTIGFHAHGARASAMSERIESVV